MHLFGFSSVPELVMLATSLLVGVTMVMGLNAVNSAPSFMLDYYKYTNGNATASPRFPKFWTNVLTFYTIVTLVAQTAHEPTNLTSFMCRFSLIFRLEVSCALMLIELLAIVLMPHTNVSETAAIAGLMVVAYIGGAGRGYFENTGYALFGPCPFTMLSGMMVGAALSGAIVSVLQIILKAAMSDSHDSVLTQSVIYFSFSIGVIFAAAVLLVALLYNPFAKHYIAEFRSRRGAWRSIYHRAADQPSAATRYEEHGSAALSKDVDGEVASPTVPAAQDEEDVLFDDRIPVTREVQLAAPQTGPVACTAEDEARGSPAGSKEDLEDPQVAAERMMKEIPTTSDMLQRVRLLPIIKRIYPMMISCFLAYFVTYLMYPGVLLAVDTASPWYGTVVMAVFNFADLLGRVLSMWRSLWLPRRVIFISSTVRIVMLPLLVLCAVHIIPSQAAGYVFTAVLAVTNGYLGTMSMIYAPDYAELTEDGERALAGQSVGVCLMLGCSIGSLVQLALVLPLDQ